MPAPMSPDTINDAVAGLSAFIDASPSPFHAVAEVAAMLREAGFVELRETDAWSANPSGPVLGESMMTSGSSEEATRCFAIREGSLVAWSTASSQGPHTPFRVVGAHTDSPNLRVKPNADSFADLWSDRRKGREILGRQRGWDQLNLEVYGGPLLNSWLDRDLGLSGRVAVRVGSGIEMRLFHVNTPLLRIPQLAIHLDRGVNDDGVKLNPQRHLSPIWGATSQAPRFTAYLADQVECEEQDVLAYDAMTHDITPCARLGHSGDLLAAPRLDNLGTTYPGTVAFLRAVAQPSAQPHIPVLVLFDHEEIGSTTNRGGDSQLLPAILERIVMRQGGTRDHFLRAMAGSVICSGDMAHAAHPNYPERMEPDHKVAINAGPVLKVNSKGKYASDATGTAHFALACQQADVPLQKFVSRGDMACGSTIGPMTAALSGAATVDVGAPMLSMHSARELCGVYDVPMYTDALAAFLAPAS